MMSSRVNRSRDRSVNTRRTSSLPLSPVASSKRRSFRFSINPVTSLPVLCTSSSIRWMASFSMRCSTMTTVAAKTVETIAAITPHSLCLNDHCQPGRSEVRLERICESLRLVIRPSNILLFNCYHSLGSFKELTHLILPPPGKTLELNSIACQPFGCRNV